MSTVITTGKSNINQVIKKEKNYMRKFVQLINLVLIRWEKIMMSLILTKPDPSHRKMIYEGNDKVAFFKNHFYACANKQA